MQFGLNAMVFPHDDRAESIEHAAAAGYDGIEPTLEPDGALDSAAAREGLRATAREHDLSIPSVTTPIFWEHPLSSTDEATRERGIQHGTAAIEAAADLGADRLLVVPGVVNRETPYDRAHENALDAMCRLAATAAEHGVTLAVENVWNDFLLSPLEFASFVDEAGKEGPVGVYFDVGNVRRYGHPEQWLRILGERVVAVHAKDYQLDVDTIEGFTYPFQGDVDWDAVASALDDIGYDGWITPEVPPYESHPEQTAPQLLENLRSVW